MKYEDSKNRRSNKYHKYRFNDDEMRIITQAVQDRINYLSGLAMLQKDTQGDKSALYEQLEEAREIQKIIEKQCH